jgi:DNA-binding transcriptional LysR family regulator
MNIRDTDLNLLRVLDAVLRERSVTGAASRLGLTQPAVSNALARLRRAFDDPLFVRSPRGMDPTPFAQALAEPVHQALGLVEAALAQRAGFDPESSTRGFRFYMSDIGEIFFLPPLIERVRREAPGVRIETVTLPLADIPAALATGELDVAVGFLPALPPPVRSRRLFRDPYVCMMRTDHPGIRTSLTRRAFVEASHVLVSSMGSGHRVIEEALEKHGITRRIALRVPHFTVLPTVLERTDLLLTIPLRIARALEKEGRLKALKLPVPIPAADIGLHWHERVERDPGNVWLRKMMVELFAE